MLPRSRYRGSLETHSEGGKDSGTSTHIVESTSNSWDEPKTRILANALEESDELTLDAFRRKYEALAIEARRALAEGQKDTNTPET